MNASSSATAARSTGYTMGKQYCGTQSPGRESHGGSFGGGGGGLSLSPVASVAKGVMNVFKHVAGGAAARVFSGRGRRRRGTNEDDDAREQQPVTDDDEDENDDEAARIPGRTESTEVEKFQ